MEWTNARVLELLEHYRRFPALWDPRHRDHKDRIKRRAAYMEIGDFMNISTDEAESKINRLRSQYNREMVKVIESKRRGKIGDDVYFPKWFAFDLMAPYMCGTTPRKVSDIVLKDMDPPRSESAPLPLLPPPPAPPPPQPPSKEIRLLNNVNKSVIRRHKKQKLKHSHHKPIEKKPDDNNCEIGKIWNSLTNVLQPERDEFTVFGEHVASQVRKLTPKQQAIAKHRIATVIYEIELQRIEEQEPETE